MHVHRPIKVLPNIKTYVKIKKIEDTHICAQAVLSQARTNTSCTLSRPHRKHSPFAQFVRIGSGDTFWSMHCANLSCSEVYCFFMNR